MLHPFKSVREKLQNLERSESARSRGKSRSRSGGRDRNNVRRERNCDSDRNYGRSQGACRIRENKRDEESRDRSPCAKSATNVSAEREFWASLKVLGCFYLFDYTHAHSLSSPFTHLLFSIYFYCSLQKSYRSFT